MKSWFLIALLLLAGCAGDKVAPPAPNKPAAPTAAEVKPDIPPLVFSQPEDYTYNPVGKRDPFRVYMGDITPKDSMDMPTSPLERFDLDQLVVTAIVWGLSEPRALLRAPDGYSYIVKKSMRLGKNRGRISRITRRVVFVEEEYRDPTGKLVVRESTLEIRQAEKDDGKRKSTIEFKYSDE